MAGGAPATLPVAPAGSATHDKKVVDAIATTEINPRNDRPVNDVVIEQVVIETR